MSNSEDLQCVYDFIKDIHKEALAKARNQCPEIDSVVDRHEIGEYISEHIDYPGVWYVQPSIPQGYRTREQLVDEIAADTVKSYLEGRREFSDDPFWALIAQYPDCAADFAIVPCEEPFCDYSSHWDALVKGAMQIFADDWKLNFKLGTIKAKNISVDEFLAPAEKDGEMNYRKAVLMPPYPNGYTDADFEKINSALFPNGTDALNVFKWSTDWSDYFDEGNEWWGSLCLTVYDSSLKRFAVIMASASD